MYGRFHDVAGSDFARAARDKRSVKGLLGQFQIGIISVYTGIYILTLDAAGFTIYIFKRKMPPHVLSHSLWSSKIIGVSPELPVVQSVCFLM
jgi:hypothetical protein